MNDEQIKKLTEYYGYTISEVVNKVLSFYSPIDDIEDCIIGGNNRQIAELIKFLRSCEGSPLKISSTIQNPYKGQVKGSNLSFNLNDKYTLLYLEQFLNTILEENQDGLYQFEFNWNFKEPIKHYKGIAPCYETEEDSFFTEPYTDEELDKIIEYEKEKESNQPKLTKNGKIGRICYSFYKALKLQGILGNNKTKDYSFIYDILVIRGKANDIGKGFSGTIGKEKYQTIRNWINAYLTQSGKKE